MIFKKKKVDKNLDKLLALKGKERLIAIHETPDLTSEDLVRLGIPTKSYLLTILHRIKEDIVVVDYKLDGEALYLNTFPDPWPGEIGYTFIKQIDRLDVLPLGQTQLLKILTENYK